MNVTIYHNPLCGTSRKTLEILREGGTEPRVIEYLKAPPSRDELKRLYDRAGISPREGLRAKEPIAEELGLIRPDVSEDEILDAMMEHPDPHQSSAGRDGQGRSPVPSPGRCARDPVVRRPLTSR